MRLIYVDSDTEAREKFERISAEIPGIETVSYFSKGSDALEFIRKNEADIVFMGIEMSEINGISLAKQIEKIRQDLHIVFITAHSTYAMQAFEVAADGYLLKSYGKEDLKNQIEKIQRKFHMKEQPYIYFQTLPRFELFVNRKLVPITKKKVKELLALLVDYAGSSLTSEQAIDFLWEDRLIDEGTKALLRMTAKRLRDVLAQAGIDYILIEENGVRAIDIRCVDSDYYQILNGNEEAMKKYHGEYMMEYSWAENTNAKLAQITGQLQAELA